MDSLYQRLKELDSDAFQRLCAQLLLEKYPSSGIRHVEGASGDGGVDIFAGTLSNILVIWQCKAFPNGVGKSQKGQIRESLKTAIRRHKPKKWILCLSVDLDSKAHIWFQRLQKLYGDRVEIELLSASDIVLELRHRRSLRNRFFPGASIDATELNRIAAKTNGRTTEELERLNKANCEDYLERLKEQDPRVNIEVAFNGEGGPVGQEPRSGLILSINRGSQLVNVIARDLKALEADPPRMSSKIRGTGVPKFLSMLETGAAQEFTSSELTDFRSDWPLVKPMLDCKEYKVVIGPSASLKAKKLKTRMTFKLGSETVEYGFVELSPVRAGTHELELVSISDHLPFQVSLVIRSGAHQGTFEFSHQFVGHDFRDVQKFLRAFRLARGGGEIVFFDLEREIQILGGSTSPQPETAVQRKTRLFVDQLVEFEDTFSVKLRVPKAITEADMHAFDMLKNCLEGRSSEAKTVTIDLVKSVENEASVPVLLQTPLALRMERGCLDPKPKLFGVEIDTGPCALVADQVIVRDMDATLEQFRKARIGEAITIPFDSLGPVRYELVRASQAKT